MRRCRPEKICRDGPESEAEIAAKVAASAKAVAKKRFSLSFVLQRFHWIHLRSAGCRQSAKQDADHHRGK